MRTKELFKFIQKRHAIYIRRAEGKPKPWTKDPILQKYRFCNVYRELDTVTQWIAKNWREPNAADPDLWFAMVVARMFNLPSALAAIGYPVPFKPSWIRAAAKVAKQQGENFFNAAYMIRCDIQSPGKTKVDYLIDKVFTPMWKERRWAASHTGSLFFFHNWLMTFYGMGSFMAGQVIADVKYTKLLENAPDWWTWAAPGPGSMRGLNRICGREVNAPWKPGEWFTKLTELRVALEPFIMKTRIPRLDAQNVQNICCEFDKYERVRLGEGRPKQLYPGLL